MNRYVAKPRMISVVVLALSALMLWASSRMSWIDVTAFDDKSGQKEVVLNGALWSPETTAVALVLLAASVAALVLQPVGRRVVGIVAAIVGAISALRPLQLLMTEPDPQRVLNLLSSENSSSKSGQGAVLSGWAEIVELTLNTPALILAIVGSACALVAGIVLAMNPGQPAANKSQYARKQQRQERIREDLVSDPDSGRVLWDAIDADIDPTAEQQP